MAENTKIEERMVWGLRLPEIFNVMQALDTAALYEPGRAQKYRRLADMLDAQLTETERAQNLEWRRTT